MRRQPENLDGYTAEFSLDAFGPPDVALRSLARDPLASFGPGLHIVDRDAEGYQARRPTWKELGKVSTFTLNAETQAHLAERGVWLHHRHADYYVGAKIDFEPPVAIAADLAYNFPIRIGAFSHLNGGYIQRVSIGRYCSLARDIQIGHGFHPNDWLSVSPLQYAPNYRGFSEFAARHGARRSDIKTIPFVFGKPTTIGNDVWIGNHVFVVDGITIGDGAIIGAGSVVTRDVDPYTIVAGNPARVLRSRFDTNLVERLLELRWWRYSLADLGAVDFSRPDVALNRLEELIASDEISEYLPDVITLPLSE
ncbi:CatB-related O-acetyltransferase [Ciceribacter thiooxidans]|uniref:CatB-related O-acetyltransferase n=1 Tax=Ciceribacter thiooxidans TaxID=1969821 RepID=A0ABV7I0B2_9HYPH|nr:CatB-related O-acetyltransferase [Ciceribacter thiooxidans]